MITDGSGKSPENKVVLVGDMGVGKTAILQRIITGKFSDSSTPTVGAASQHIDVDMGNGQAMDLTLWDTAGQERYQNLIPLYLRNAKGILFVCDVTAKNTVQTLNAIYTSLSDVDKNTAIYLVGNKIDLVSSSTTDLDYPELSQWAEDHHMFFRAVSAKTGFGIQELFTSMALSISQLSSSQMTTNPKSLHSKTHSMCC